MGIGRNACHHVGQDGKDLALRCSKSAEQVHNLDPIRIRRSREKVENLGEDRRTWFNETGGVVLKEGMGGL